MSNELSKYFGVDELRETLPALQSEALSLENDSEEVKHNLKMLVQTGNRALEEMLNLAIDSESEKAYIALANLIETLGNINEKIIDIHSKTTNIKVKSGNASSPTNVTSTTNNVVFTGTTKDLAKFLENLKSGDQNIIDNGGNKNE